MRVLIGSKFFYHRGGAERAAIDQAQWLPRAGHEVAVITQNTTELAALPSAHALVEPAFFDAGPVAALRHVGRLFWSVEVARLTSALVTRFRPDVALLHNTYHQLGPALVLTLARLGVPIVMILHDQKLVCPAYSGLRRGQQCNECTGGSFSRAALHACGGSRTKGALLAAESHWQWNVVRAYDKVHTLVAPSEYLRQRLLQMGLSRPVSLLRNGVSLSTEPPLPFSERRYVGFAGRLSSEKGLDLLVGAAQGLPQLMFRVAGTGPDLPRLQRRLGAENISNVQMLGRLDQDALRREMRSWRLAVVPSLMYENCPYAVLDALACHVPVLGADAGGIAELTCVEGLRFERGNQQALQRAIEACFDDLELLERQAEAGWRFAAEHCSPERHLAGLADLLRGARTVG